uniref:Chemosensory protein n=1 Tax=Blattella germanica TaxID=6973 RepID=A0A120HTV3_BLAGE|nr:chemosensory protein [Blattella germanica]
MGHFSCSFIFFVATSVSWFHIGGILGSVPLKNDNLLSEMTNLNKIHPTLSRVTRGEIAVPNEPCCGNVMFNMDAFKEEIKECMEEKGERQMAEKYCLFECVGSKRFLTDDDGKLVKDEVLEFAPSVVEGDPNLEELAKSITKRVIDVINEMAADMMLKEKPKCNPALDLYFQFLFVEIVTTCPENMKSKSKACKEFRRKFEG